MNLNGKTYAERLDDAWAEHLAPKPVDAPTVISTFAGCGGSSLGYSMAGFHELLAVEWDDNAVETFKANFPGVGIHHGDICDLSVEDVLEQTGLKPGELDLFDGSPPCQGFSTSGKRLLDDERNQLFREFGRLLAGLRPKAFVMENVSGMVRGKMRLLFVEILKHLKGFGYRVSARLMNAMYFDVPQSRRRLIFVGVREDLGVEPSHPGPAGKPVKAGEGLVGCKATKKVANLANVATRIWHTSRPGQNGGQLDWTKGNYFNVAKVDPNKPAPTIMKSIGGTGMHLHWAEPRVLTVEEAARLTSFPDQFEFTGKNSEQWGCIGNSVPPLFMRAIAGHVRREVLRI